MTWMRLQRSVVGRLLVTVMLGATLGLPTLVGMAADGTPIPVEATQEIVTPTTISTDPDPTMEVTPTPSESPATVLAEPTDGASIVSRSEVSAAALGATIFPTDATHAASGSTAWVFGVRSFTGLEDGPIDIEISFSWVAQPDIPPTCAGTGCVTPQVSHDGSSTFVSGAGSLTGINVVWVYVTIPNPTVVGSEFTVTYTVTRSEQVIGSATVVFTAGDPPPTPTATTAPTATPTNTPVPTETPTNTPVPTATPTNTPVPTATPTNTPIPTATPTNTPVPTATPTNTPVPTMTPTQDPPTETVSPTPGPTTVAVKALPNTGAGGGSSFDHMPGLAGMVVALLCVLTLGGFIRIRVNSSSAGEGK